MPAWIMITWSPQAGIRHKQFTQRGITRIFSKSERAIFDDFSSSGLPSGKIANDCFQSINPVCLHIQ